MRQSLRFEVIIGSAVCGPGSQPPVVIVAYHDDVKSARAVTIKGLHVAGDT